MNHKLSLEDTIIVLSDNEEIITTRDRRLAQNIVKSIKRKRRKQKETMNGSDTSDDIKKRTLLCFRVKVRSFSRETTSKISSAKLNNSNAEKIRLKQKLTIRTMNNVLITENEQMHTNYEQCQKIIRIRIGKTYQKCKNKIISDYTEGVNQNEEDNKHFDLRQQIGNMSSENNLIN